MSHEIEQNLADIQERIARAAERSGRPPSEIELVAVTKHRSIELTDAVLEAGQRILGENRVSEAVQKIEHYEKASFQPPIEWHFIGHLQSRKAKDIVGRVAMIHSVDSLKLAETLQRRADMVETTVNFLMQFNVSGEASKYGLAPENAVEVIDGLATLDRIRCRGLMTMAPFYDDPERTRPVFRRLRELRDRLGQMNREYLDLRHLSMGMTNDFEVAVEEGATLVRVGTAIFEGTD
ncbi:MAG: YggS family pyridoxal phosphate-dependent enzyme [Candidatus Sumerlaeota bacterium]